MPKTRFKNPLGKAIYLARKAKAKLQAVRSKTDIEIPIPNDPFTIIEGKGCKVYTNLHTGRSAVDVDSCESLKKVSKNPQTEKRDPRIPVIPSESSQSTESTENS